MNAKRIFLTALSLSLLWATGARVTAAPAQDSGLAAEAQDYALREAQSEGLEEFVGGFHEAIVAIVFIALVVWVVFVILDYHHHVHEPPPPPPPEPRP
ncbi:MAG: hypothetical protein HY716_14240 [Planctomycetes bacterium]|nr:hypothetical protein [Planctomycetota bacterium]